MGTGQFENKLNIEKGLALPGARILQVAAGSPAEKAGLKVGEVMLAVDGTQINAQNNLRARLSSHKPGDSVRMSVQSAEGTQRELTVTLGDHPQSAGTAYLGVTTGGFGCKSTIPNCARTRTRRSLNSRPGTGSVRSRAGSTTRTAAAPAST